MWRRTAALFVALASTATACGGDGEDAPGRPGQAAETIPIRVDARSDEVPASWIHFFPSRVRARPGDTLEFTAEFTGEPHTVAGGTLVQEVAGAFRDFTGGGGHGAAPEGPRPPELQALLAKLPLTFDEYAPPDAPPDRILVQAGMQPCFSERGDPPTRDACPEDRQDLPEELTGKERYFNTGFMEDEDSFRIRLADDLAPGTYHFICQVHGPEMTAEVEVVAAGEPRPGAAEVRRAGRSELEEMVDAVRADAEEVVESTSVQARAGATAGSEHAHAASINVFPREIQVRSGQAVTWTHDGLHTVSFDAPEDARPLFVKDGTGEVVVNEKTVGPAGSPSIPPPPGPAGGGADGPPPQVRVDGGTYDGRGFRSSGLPRGPVQLVWSLTFTRPGTYRYLCLVHPDMEGTVRVS